MRLLIFQDDKLPAISGIAREIQRQSGFTYKAGIWLEDISRGLAWDTSGAGKQPEQYQAPSWSWAGLDVLEIGDRPIREPTYHFSPYAPHKKAEFARHSAEIVAYEVISRDGDPYGCVKSGYIQPRGRILPVTKWNAIAPPYFFAYWTTKGVISHYYRNYNKDHCISRDQLILEFNIFPPGGDESTVNLKNVSMFQLSTWDWTAFQQDRNLVTLTLLLEPVDDLGNFRRVNVAEVPNYNGLADEWDIADVTIS